VLQAAVRAGHGLGDAARQASMVAANWHARVRLRRWAEALDRGAEPAEAAQQCGFPSPFVRALSGAVPGEDLPARLDYLASYYDALGMHWNRLLLSVAAPLLVLLWGAVVLVVALALIQPVVALYESVMRTLT
jgi:type II secretory pathway component PulF